MMRPRAIRRAFPDYGWAWPRGEHDRLLRAILVSDATDALGHGLAWLAANDIDAAPGRDIRLLAALCHRFGERLAPAPAYPRLIGLQRLNWSRARLAEAAAAPVLAALEARGLAFMLIKGAARIASDPAVRRGRVAHDVDILVAPDAFGAAIEVLESLDWRAATGLGPERLRRRVASLRALNFLKGAHGDIDLHRFAYHPHQSDAADDAALWRRAGSARFADVIARVPSPADQIALAIGHGSLDAHIHSDWLVDVDRIARAGGVDWSVFAEIVRARGLAVAAASALGYLGVVIGTPIPSETLAAIVDMADRAGWPARSALLECKPRSDFSRWSAGARGVTKMVRLWRAAPPASDEIVWRAHWLRPAAAPAEVQLATVVDVPPAPRPSRKLRLRLTLAVSLPEGRRRIEFDLVAGGQHLLTLRYRKRRWGARACLLRFSGTLDLSQDIRSMTVRACAARFLRPGAPASDEARYGPVPFSLVDVRMAPSG